ncbi:MAG: NYN domain-containing protein [Candidatus Omnitrophica bacterium]|nr:NYN domain-containing protein [Candidatus Omnitrophota bacterium]
MKAVILDAYNVIHAIPSLIAKADRSLQASREALAHLVMAWKRANKFNGEIYLVFDGKGDVFTRNQTSTIAGVKCLFTQSGEEADDRIITILKRAKNTKNIIVVSDDGKVINACKVYGASSKPTEYVVQRGVKISGTSGKKAMDVSTEKAITEFYKKKLGL